MTLKGRTNPGFTFKMPHPLSNDEDIRPRKEIVSVKKTPVHDEKKELEEEAKKETKEEANKRKVVIAGKDAGKVQKKPLQRDRSSSDGEGVVVKKKLRSHDNAAVKEAVLVDDDPMAVDDGKNDESDGINNLSDDHHEEPAISNDLRSNMLVIGPLPFKLSLKHLKASCEGVRLRELSDVTIGMSIGGLTLASDDYAAVLATAKVALADDEVTNQLTYTELCQRELDRTKLFITSSRAAYIAIWLFWYLELRLIRAGTELPKKF